MFVALCFSVLRTYSNQMLSHLGVFIFPLSKIVSNHVGSRT